MGGFTKKMKSKKPSKDEVKIIPRDVWGAQPIKGKVVKLKHPVQFVRYGYTGTASCKAHYKCEPVLIEFQQKYLDNNFADQPFNFLIGGDGLVYEGRGWDLDAERPDKIDKKIKGNAIDIAFIGDFSEHEPFPKMLEVSDLLLQYGIEERYIQPQPKILNLNDFTPLLKEEE